MWGYLYGRDFGPIGQAFRAVGLEAPNFFSEQNMLGAIMNVVTWSFVGYNMVIMYSALRVIPHELYEAAEIDGASQLRIAWSIKIPALRPALLVRRGRRRWRGPHRRDRVGRPAGGVRPMWH